jgi:hypothetical protein
MKKVKKLHPNAPVAYRCQDVTTVEGKFASIFLDWCGTITPTSLQASFPTDKVRAKGLLALGFSYNRDRNKPPKGVGSVDWRVRLVLDHIKKNNLPFGLKNAWAYYAAREDRPEGTAMLYLLFKKGPQIHTSRAPTTVKLTEEKCARHIKSLRTKALTYQDLVSISDLWMVEPSSIPAWQAWRTRTQGVLT